MTDPKPNLDLLRRVLRQIDDHPETWEQGDYAVKGPCGTAFCVAGHAVVMSGYKIKWCEGVDDNTHESSCTTVDGQLVPPLAEQLLGITSEESDSLFFGGNSRDNIQRIAEAIAANRGEKL